MNKDTFACIACGEYYPESEIKHFTNGEAICIHCNFRMQKYDMPHSKAMIFDESKRPKFKYEEKYGKMVQLGREIAPNPARNLLPQQSARKRHPISRAESPATIRAGQHPKTCAEPPAATIRAEKTHISRAE